MSSASSRRGHRVRGRPRGQAASQHEGDRFCRNSFMSLAIVFSVHGLSTPHFLIHPSPLPSVSSPLSLIFATIWLWMSSAVGSSVGAAAFPDSGDAASGVGARLGRVRDGVAASAGARGVHPADRRPRQLDGGAGDDPASAGGDVPLLPLLPLLPVSAPIIHRIQLRFHRRQSIDHDRRRALAHQLVDLPLPIAVVDAFDACRVPEAV